jgi:ATP-dependent exoDNAse (exonuclease V) beta subunit
MAGVAPQEAETVEQRLTAEQRAAIGARDRDVFTEAGAGTGKTGVLVERYCDAVTEDGVSPDRILAFTFTERAAGELRERVRRRLMGRARAASEEGDAERARQVARAAREGERAWITTIHGFCRRLLAMHPVGAGMDPRFRVLDEVEATRLAQRGFETALEEVLESANGATARFAAAFHAPRLREMVQAAHERLRSQGVDPPRLPDPGPPRRSVKDRGEAPELSATEARQANEGLGALRAMLATFHHHYERSKAERSGADFEDLELRALDLLRATGPIGQAWRDRFEHLMVDEFQDTNRVQLALIDALRGPQTRLFVVGDEFQSIYRFRHADLEVFRARRQAADTEPGTEKRPLRGNFRSRPEVLAAVDLAGSVLLDGFVPLEAGREVAGDPVGGPPATELLLTDASDEGPGQRTGWRAEEIALEPPPSETTPSCVAEARFLARRLRELADGGVPREHMVVLLRAFTHVDAFEEALDRVGLAPYVVGGRGYWSQQQVEDALRLLGVVANPLDDELLFGALASPVCGVSPDALWLLRQAARDPDGRPLHVWPTVAEGEWPVALPANDASRLERFREVLAGLRAEAPLRPLDSMIDRAISAFDYDLALLAMPSGRRRLANVRKLMRLAREYEQHEGRDLRGFLDFAEERTRRDEREGMAAVQVEGHDGVRVMTVHAAKGLEFPVVAVADLGRGLGAGSRAPDVVIGRLAGDVGDPAGAPFGMRLPVVGGDSIRLWDLVELCDADRTAEIQEACRLVYVAASRAQERLILSGTHREGDLEATDQPKPGHSALKILLPALRARGWSGEEGEVELERAPAVGGGEAGGATPALAVRIQRPTAERAAELRLRTPWPHAEANGNLPHPTAPLLPARPRALGAGHLSYSALADYARCRYRFYVERVVGAGSPLAPEPQSAAPSEDLALDADELVEPALGPRRRSLAIGNAVHAALEWSARRGWAQPPDAALGSILAREGLPADAEALERVRALLVSWTGSGLRGELAACDQIKPEVPFVLGLGGTVVRGKMDLLVESTTGPLVVDYKTDALRGADPEQLAERYATQRDLYALAAHARRPQDPAGLVRAAHCFLEAPDHTVIRTYDAAGLDEARRRLEGLIEGIRAGDFRRTDDPHPSLCFGCPAAARLCGKPAWRPSWAASRSAAGASAGGG